MTRFELLVLGWIFIALIILPVNLKIKAPYGRHTNNKWGPTITNILGWVIMELPAMTLVPLLALIGPLEKSPALYLIIGFWLIHYVHRTLIFPFRTKTSKKQIPLSIVLMAIVFNGGNGALNGYFFGHIQTYAVDWLLSGYFIVNDK